ncbi:MAG: hypothetical protein AB1489_22860 [Acidobacteriota bacterium]
MDKLVSIIRTPDQLMALISRPKYQFKLPLDKSPGTGVARLKFFYETTLLPLATISNNLYTKKDRLITAWDYLRSVCTFNADTLYHILIVLIETQADNDPNLSTIPLLSPNLITPPKKPSKAYLRIHKGLRYQLPKPKQAAPIDLRRYLCDEKNIHLLLSLLSRYWVEGLEKLVRAGYTINSLAAWSEINFNSFDPYYAYHYSLINNVSKKRLPKTFIRYILPLLKGSHWSEVLDYLSIYWGLSLDKNPSLLMVITRLLSLSRNHENILSWCKVITRQPHNRRAIFATLLIKSGAYTMNAANINLEVLDQFNEVTPRAFYSPRLYFFLLGIKRGIEPNYLLDGFRLAKRYKKDYQFTKLNNCTTFSYYLVTELIDYLSTGEDYFYALALRVWERCGELAGFDEVLAKIPWREIPVEAASCCLSFFLDFINHYVKGDALAQKWRFVRQELDCIATLLGTIDKDYLRKLINTLDYCYWYWDEVDNLRTCMPVVYTLLKRLCQPPFKKNTTIEEVVCCFIARSHELMRKRFLAAPDENFIYLEKALRSKNASRLIADALWDMMKTLAEFTFEGFLTDPKRLLEATRLLGSLSKQTRLLVLAKFKKEFIKDTNESISVDASNVNNKLDLLKDLVMAVLIGDQSLSTDRNIVFSLQLSQLIDSNKRAFKRFLKAYFQGKRDYLQTHFLTQTWIKKQSTLNIELWREGIIYICETENHGTISITVEKDPLEALRMGEYVGSCLGLGGVCSYSAVAAVLDINKQVLYARNEKNGMIARQLVAISKERQLVCFEVYPLNIDKEIKMLFCQYDIKFAQALGLELFDYKNAEKYTIENILSEEWWDDYAWDLTV